MGSMSVRILVGDCRQTLATLPDGSVQTCVTSPPYFGLRDYGTATWEGGDVACDHKTGKSARNDGARIGVDGFGGNRNVDGHADMGALYFAVACAKCGARRVDSQIGLEQTPDAYVAELVAVFREVRRVLRDDGTLWLNLGDSYAGGNTAGAWREGAARADGAVRGDGETSRRNRNGNGPVVGLKPKDLIGIPWRVAFALQADGWWLRQDIIWHKPNPMPESVQDRCTKAHEYIFLLTKRERYFYDANAIAEPAIHAGKVVTNDNGKNGQMDEYGQTREGFLRDGGVLVGDTRNKRSVWTVPSQPFADAHFATFPPALIEPCILAGSKRGDTVLDPFGGAGTTGLVADRFGRDAILCELNPGYAAMAEDRITAEQPLLADVKME